MTASPAATFRIPARREAGEAESDRRRWPPGNRARPPGRVCRRSLARLGSARSRGEPVPPNRTVPPGARMSSTLPPNDASRTAGRARDATAGHRTAAQRGRGSARRVVRHRAAPGTECSRVSRRRPRAVAVAGPPARVGDVTGHPGVVEGPPGVPTVLIGGLPAAVVGTPHVCSFPPPAVHPAVGDRPAGLADRADRRHARRAARRHGRVRGPDHHWRPDRPHRRLIPGFFVRVHRAPVGTVHARGRGSRSRGRSAQLSRISAARRRWRLPCALAAKLVPASISTSVPRIRTRRTLLRVPPRRRRSR